MFTRADAMNSQKRFSLTFPRKRRVPKQQSESEAVAPLPKRMRTRELLATASTSSKPACAHAPPQALLVPDGDRSSAVPTSTASVSALACRVACGRSLQALQLLADMRIFNLDDALELPMHAPLVPLRGIQTMLDGEPVYILDTFTRSGSMSKYMIPLHYII